MILSVIKKIPFLYITLLYIWQKCHNRKKVKFWFSSHLSYRCKFEGMNLVDKRSSFFGTMGYGTYIRDECNVSADIGRFTSIGARCNYINSLHAYKAPFVTTCPLFFSKSNGRNPKKKTFADKQMIEEFRYYDREKELVNKIGNDCWIGMDVTLIGGIEIGDGAVVLTHAVVTKNVPPFAIVGGIPAHIIGYRYDQETIDFLMKVKWWDNDIEWFRKNWRLLNDIEKLKKYYGWDR